jgi:hypothetical protein
MKCEDCKFWQDFSDRVTANISNARSAMSRDKIELRRCHNTPPPAVVMVEDIYTDKDFSCGGFVSKGEKEL